MKNRINPFLPGLTLLMSMLLPMGQVLAQSPGQIPEKVLHYADTIVVNGNIVTMDNKEMLSTDPGSIYQGPVHVY
ncbi:MAG: hypothetical protein GTO60_02535 [Gammaproteobacteria bacterium]|nr:hypothetical protein [Gammaproteobacteria bacterium]